MVPSPPPGRPRVGQEKKSDVLRLGQEKKSDVSRVGQEKKSDVSSVGQFFQNDVSQGRTYWFAWCALPPDSRSGSAKFGIIIGEYHEHARFPRSVQTPRFKFPCETTLLLYQTVHQLQATSLYYFKQFQILDAKSINQRYFLVPNLLATTFNMRWVILFIVLFNSLKSIDIFMKIQQVKGREDLKLFGTPGWDSCSLQHLAYEISEFL